MATESKIRLLQLNPHFLYSNSTSHSWPFGAFAELIDNAYDPDVMAKEICIDKCKIGSKICITVTDDGNGMDFDGLWKMLCLGYCDKSKYEDSKFNRQPIGKFGNGFKSGSMRLAEDALIFTCNIRSASVGFLSRSYLDNIGTQSAIAPFIAYDVKSGSKEKPMQLVKQDGWKENLDVILNYSVYQQEEHLRDVLDDLLQKGSGTKIILSNLAKSSEESDELELDFETDRKDIRFNNFHSDTKDEQQSPTYRSSLREYCKILYIQPRMKISIRGQRVKTVCIERSLYSTAIFYHKFRNMKDMKITIGFNCKSSNEDNDYGLMLYHRKRLILAYEKIGCQLGRCPCAVGVVIVAETDMLTPKHNKQDFEMDKLYSNAKDVFRKKLRQYWEDNAGYYIDSLDQQGKMKPDSTWVQCDNCNKWRRLIQNVDPNTLPDKWYCRENADNRHNLCSDPEESETSDEIHVGSRKRQRSTASSSSRSGSVEITPKKRQYKRKSKSQQSHKESEVSTAWSLNFSPSEKYTAKRSLRKERVVARVDDENQVLGDDDDDSSYPLEAATVSWEISNRAATQKPTDQCDTNDVPSVHEHHVSGGDNATVIDVDEEDFDFDIPENVYIKREPAVSGESIPSSGLLAEGSNSPHGHVDLGQTSAEIYEHPVNNSLDKDCHVVNVLDEDESIQSVQNDSDRDESILSVQNNGDRDESILSVQNDDDQDESILSVQNDGDQDESIQSVQNDGDQDESIQSVQNDGDQDGEVPRVKTKQVSVAVQTGPCESCASISRRLERFGEHVKSFLISVEPEVESSLTNLTDLERLMDDHMTDSLEHEETIEKK